MNSLNTNNGIKSVTALLSEDLPTLQELTTPFTSSSSTSSMASTSSSSSNSIASFFSSITWQTWIIVVLLLALIGINIFAYLAKGTQVTANIFDTIFGPILKLFGYATIETTKQTIETTATGTTAGVNAVANTSVNALNTVEQGVQNGATTPMPTSGTSVGVSTSTPQGQMASSSQQGVPLKQQYEAEATLEQYQENSLEKALSNASQNSNQMGGGIQPYDTSAATGKAGWCFIGDDLGVRTCSEVGVNDVCMSGDVFPSQEICMNPNLRA